MLTEPRVLVKRPRVAQGSAHVLLLVCVLSALSRFFFFTPHQIFSVKSDIWARDPLHCTLLHTEKVRFH